MSPKPFTQNIYSVDTEEIENALEMACNGNLQLTYRLELRRLATLLWYDAKLKKQGGANQNHIEPLKALTNFKANLRRRKKASDTLTSSRLMEVPEPARAILLSDIAFVFRNDVDDYTKIDFSNERHVELLGIAVDKCISKVANKQGRPVNEALDVLFIGLKDLYEAATSKTAIPSDSDFGRVFMVAGVRNRRYLHLDFTWM
jgi:hypothetical protein